MVAGALVRRASWRRLWRHPWQMVLLILGVAMGVAVVVAVDLANASATRAFELSMENVAGRATHQIVGGPAGIDDRTYARLRRAGVRDIAPLVEAFGEAGGETLRLLGVDPLAESPFRGHIAGLPGDAVQRLMAEPGTALLAAPTAARLGVQPGDRLALEIGGRVHALTIVGLLSTRDGAAAIDGLLIADIATAQDLADATGRLSWIDAIIPQGAAGARLRERIIETLPPEAVLVTAESRTQALSEMTRAFRVNLTAMSLLALVVGMFLVYNTMTFAVLQRRPLIGTLRMLGVTGGEVFRLVLAEALALGLLGTAFGLLLGIVLGQGLVQLVTRTIDDLYFVLTVTDLPLTPGPLLKGFALGLLAALAATLGPALEAARTSPRSIGSRAALEGGARRAAPLLAAVGAAMMLAALLLLLLPTRGLVAGFAVLFLLILGLTLMTPLVVAGMARAGAPLFDRLGLQARLALRGIRGSLSRTGVAIAALMLAVSTTVGVGIMVDSFRASVAVWLDSTLSADLYVSSPTLMTERTPARLPPEAVERVRNLPGLAAVVRARNVTIESPQGLTEVLALDSPPDRAARHLLQAGDPQSVWNRFAQGSGVLVTEPYAYRHDIRPGDTVPLRTAAGMQEFTVLGVLTDYSSEQGTVVMHRDLYLRHFDDPAVSSLRLYLAPGIDAKTAADAVRGVLPPGEALVRSQGELRALSFDIFERTFTITNVLRLLAVLVAFVGILSALMALQLERAREFAVLRATGFTPGQLQGLVAAQTGLMGLAAGLLALPVGLLLAAALIHVINRRAFGWTLQTSIAPEVLVEAVLLAVVAALIAGLYPAWKLARALPATALREE